jgi:hypothetical protein
MKTILAIFLLLLTSCATTTETHGKWHKGGTADIQVHQTLPDGAWDWQNTDTRTVPAYAWYEKKNHETKPCVSSLLILGAEPDLPKNKGTVQFVWGKGCEVSAADILALSNEHYIKGTLDPQEAKMMKTLGLSFGADVGTTMFCQAKGFREGNKLLGAGNPAALLASIAVPYALFYVSAATTPVYHSMHLKPKELYGVSGLRFAAAARNLIICL